jgi:hypothetical protein
MKYDYFGRPPLGFIVEGKGEYYSYPSIVSRIVKACGFCIPVSNAEGYGGILNHIDEHLTDMISSWKPVTIIVTMDLIDVIRAGIVEDCKELTKTLSDSIFRWVEQNKSSNKFVPFPDLFKIIVQIPKFEAWLIADKANLKRGGYIHEEGAPWLNVDDEVSNPVQWLEENCQKRINVKHPGTCKEMVTAIDVEIVRGYSRSFDKFYREVKFCYDFWLEKCGQP